MPAANSEARESRALWLFVGVVLGLPVLYWLVFYLAERAGWALPRFLSGSIRSYGPTFAAIAALSYSGGRDALRDLWSSVIRWRAPGRLWALVFLGPLAVIVVIFGVVRAVAPESLAPGDVNPLKLVAIFVVMIFLDGPLGEEPGWRGYFLPALMRRYDAFVATLLVAVVWYLWHLPHYHVDGRLTDVTFLWKYLLFMFALAFMHTWLFKRSGGSVLLNIVFHNMTNFIVLSGFTLFPALREETLDNTIYFICTCAVGALAAWSVWRDDRRPSAKSPL